MTDTIGPVSPDGADHPGPDRRAPRSLGALGYIDYLRYWLASIVSNTGSMMYLAAIGWVVEDTTDSTSKVTLVAVLGMIPMLVMSPIGGSLADRYPRTKVFAVTVLGQMGVAVALAVAYQLDMTPFWALCLFSVIGGIPGAAGAPVQQALVVELVGPEAMRNAVFLNSVQWNLSRAAGPMLGGLLIELGGPATAFWFNAVSFVALLIGLQLIPARPPATTASGEGLWRAFVEGYRYARRSRGIMVVMTASFMLAVSISPLQWLAPVIASDAFDVSAGGFGVLLGSFGVGSLIGAVALLSLDANYAYSRMSATGFGLLSVFILGVAAAPVFWLGVVAMAGAGFSFMVVMPTLTSSLQALSDDAYRGRVLSLWMMLFGIAAPLSVLVEGLVAEVVGIRWVLGAVAAIDAAFLVGLLASRQLRHIDGDQ